MHYYIFSKKNFKKKMNENIKQALKKLFRTFHIDITKNLKYDRQTGEIFKRIINPSSVCIDIGCHKGEMLIEMMKYAPLSKHYAFEPIPFFYKGLVERFGKTCNIYPYALSNTSGETTFQFVKNAPGYSGILKRRYDKEHVEIEELKVQMATLDEVIPSDAKIDLIKIDVEGAEFNVLKGGLQTLKRCKPVVVFECGLGGSDYYGTTPESLFEFINTDAGMKLSTLINWLKGKPALTKEEFCNIFNTTSEYYFIAYV
jgi:FkbM family methyltransferase